MTLGAAAVSSLLATVSAQASHRLLQLSLSDLAAPAVGLICQACSQLRRLRLARCEVGLHRHAVYGPLVSPALEALPTSLTVLELIACDANLTDGQPIESAPGDATDATIPASTAATTAETAEGSSFFALELSLPRLQHLDCQLNSSECGPRLSFGGGGEGLSRLTELRSLDVCGHSLFGDAALSAVVQSCDKLHTLAIAHTAVTARGLGSLNAALGPSAATQPPPPLPRLRVCLYANLMFESGLEGFLTPLPSLEALEEQQAQALADEAEKDLFIEQAGDLVASHAQADELIRAFFAFCALAVQRDLLVPFERTAASWRRGRPYVLSSCFALEYEPYCVRVR